MVEVCLRRAPKLLTLAWRKSRIVSREEIENSFARAGWHLDGGFADNLAIGYTDDGLSILARQEAWETDQDGLSILDYEEARETDADDPVFELIDHEKDLTYAVWEIPTPEEAREMLREHGQPPEDGY
jgi:hypothetical protein